MAVSGKTAAPHEIPYYLDGDNPPSMATVTKALADQTHARLNAIDAGQVVGGSSGKLLIAGTTGAGAFKAMSGDATIDKDGVLQLGSKVVGTAELGDGAATDGKLASPNNGSYKLVHRQDARMTNSVVIAAGTYIVALNRSVEGKVESGALLPSGASALDDQPSPFNFVPGDYAVAGLSQKLRLRVMMLIGGSMERTFTYGLYPFTISGGGLYGAITLGAVVAGSTAEIKNPGANTATRVASVDFTPPAEGAYLIGVAISGSGGSAAGAHISGQLYSRNVP